MNRREPDTADIIADGIMGILILGLVATIIFGVIQLKIAFLFAILGIVGFCSFVYALGWCICHRYDFYNLFKTEVVEEKQRDEEPDYGDPILDGLSRFERKYNFSTLWFMRMVSVGHIPKGMDNLDYIEWLSLVNELPSLHKTEEILNA